MMKRIAFPLALTVVALAPVLACSAIPSEPAATDRAAVEATLCYAPDDPLVLSGAVGPEQTCMCPADVDLEDAAVSAPAEDPLQVVEAPATSDDGAGILPQHHETSGGGCKVSDWCGGTPKGSSWGKQKLKELAACIGIAAACLGGDAEVPKAIVKLTQAVCCAKGDDKHRTASKDLSAAVSKACGIADAGK